MPYVTTDVSTLNAANQLLIANQLQVQPFMPMQQAVLLQLERCTKKAVGQLRYTAS